MTRVVLASSNVKKLRELAAILAPVGFELELQSNLGVVSVEETGTTFIENALLKARHAARATGLAALADDSGLEVDALGGRPGVYSARFAGEGATDTQNLEKLLQELAGVPTDRRTARYRCAIAFVKDALDTYPLITEGAWEGRILSAPRGSGGFGYDPIFLPSGMQRTAAELAPLEKNAISHRAIALQALIRALPDTLKQSPPQP